MFQTKAGTKYFLGAEGANLWKAKTDLSAWDTPALKTNCSNAIFDNATFFDKVYMGNGSNMLSYDGSTLATMTGAPTFTVIEAHKTRLWCNDSTEPTLVYYTDFDINGVPTVLNTDHYIRISEDSGDKVKGLARILTHLVVANEFSTYAIYGSSIDDFTKILIGPVGAVNNRSIANVNERVYLLSQDGIYGYAGSGIQPVSFDLGRFEDIVNTARLSYSCAIGYNNCYWLAIAAKGSTSNDIVLIYDTMTRKWVIVKYPFSINQFCLDGNDLYCATADKKVYKLETGTLDDSTAITSNWISDPMDLGAPGRKKRVRNIAIEMGEIAAGGTLNLYLKEDNGTYSTALPYTIPTASPGKTVVVKAKSNKFYNLTVKLETTASITIDKMTFGGKVKEKVK